jgi:hypothetical protein
LKKFALALGMLVSLGVVAVAQGVVVQDFSFQIKDVKSGGRFTVVFDSHSYDPSGGIPVPLNENYIRIPKGAAVRKTFKKAKFYCPAKKLVDQVRMDKGNGRFTPYLDNLLKGKPRAPKNAKSMIKTCRYAQIGTGRVLVDARPYADDPIPADLRMFWTKPDKGAAATFSIVGIPDERAPIVANNRTIRETVPVINASFYSDPTPDGLYDYKLVLPTGPINGIQISVAEVHVTTRGLFLTKRKVRCKKHRHGKCVRRKVKKKHLFWFSQPPCPPSGQFSFQAFYGYANDPDETKTISIPCPKFKR